MHSNVIPLYILYCSRPMSEISPENDSSADLNGDGAISSTEKELSPLKRKWMSLSPDTRDDIKTTILSFAFALLVRVVTDAQEISLELLNNAHNLPINSEVTLFNTIV
jgi:hypothetical protein